MQNLVYIDALGSITKHRLGREVGEQVSCINGTMKQDIIKPIDLALFTNTIILAIDKGRYSYDKLVRFIKLSYKYAGKEGFDSIVRIGYSAEKGSSLTIKWVKEPKQFKTGTYFYMKLNPLDIVSILFYGVLANTKFERVQNVGVSNKVRLTIKYYEVMPKRDYHDTNLLVTTGEKAVLDGCLENVHSFSGLTYSNMCDILFSSASDIYIKKETK